MKTCLFVIIVSSVPSGRAVLGTDGGGELYESAELPRHLPAAGRQAESARRAERTAEVPDGPGARCVSTPTWFPGLLRKYSASERVTHFKRRYKSGFSLFFFKSSESFVNNKLDK